MSDIGAAARLLGRCKTGDQLPQSKGGTGKNGCECYRRAEGQDRKGRYALANAAADCQNGTGTHDCIDAA